jgi:hypothetical protein
MVTVLVHVDDPHLFESLYSETQRQEEQCTCDCSIRCTDGTVLCHKEVFVYWSSYLKERFKITNTIWANTSSRIMKIILPLFYLGEIFIDEDKIDKISEIVYEFIEQNQLAIVVHFPLVRQKMNY